MTPLTLPSPLPPFQPFPIKFSNKQRREALPAVGAQGVGALAEPRGRFAKPRAVTETQRRVEVQGRFLRPVSPPTGS